MLRVTNVPNLPVHDCKKFASYQSPWVFFLFQLQLQICEAACGDLAFGKQVKRPLQSVFLLLRGQIRPQSVISSTCDIELNPGVIEPCGYMGLYYTLRQATCLKFNTNGSLFSTNDTKHNNGMWDQDLNSQILQIQTFRDTKFGRIKQQITPNLRCAHVWIFITIVSSYHIWCTSYIWYQ